MKLAMNQSEIRFFVSTMNMVESHMPISYVGSELGIDDIIRRLDDLLERDEKISDEVRATLDEEISNLRCAYECLRSNLSSLDCEIDSLIPVVCDGQAWRYEPYPWPHAPASPLIPLLRLA